MVEWGPTELSDRSDRSAQYRLWLVNDVIYAVLRMVGGPVLTEQELVLRIFGALSFWESDRFS
jgi:hypothetical protein